MSYNEENRNEKRSEIHKNFILDSKAWVVVILLPVLIIGFLWATSDDVIAESKNINFDTSYENEGKFKVSSDSKVIVITERIKTDSERERMDAAINAATRNEGGWVFYELPPGQASVSISNEIGGLIILNDLDKIPDLIIECPNEQISSLDNLALNNNAIEGNYQNVKSLLIFSFDKKTQEYYKVGALKGDMVELKNMPKNMNGKAWMLMYTGTY